MSSATFCVLRKKSKKSYFVPLGIVKGNRYNSLSRDAASGENDGAEVFGENGFGAEKLL